MGWDNILMVFADLLNDSDVLNDKDFYVTRDDIVKATNLCPTTISNNLSVCVKNGWLKRVEVATCYGRDVRYYINNSELIVFVNKFLR